MVTTSGFWVSDACAICILWWDKRKQTLSCPLRTEWSLQLQRREWPMLLLISWPSNARASSGLNRRPRYQNTLLLSWQQWSSESSLDYQSMPWRSLLHPLREHQHYAPPCWRHFPHFWRAESPAYGQFTSRKEKPTQERPTMDRWRKPNYCTVEICTSGAPSIRPDARRVSKVRRLVKPR